MRRSSRISISAPIAGHDQRREDEAAPEAEAAADLGGDAVGNVDAQHVERAVGDIDDAADAEDQRQAGADEEQAGSGGQAVERLEEEGVERHGFAHRSAAHCLAHCSLAAPDRGDGAQRASVMRTRTGVRFVSTARRLAVPRRDDVLAQPLPTQQGARATVEPYPSAERRCASTHQSAPGAASSLRRRAASRWRRRHS